MAEARSPKPEELMSADKARTQFTRTEFAAFKGHADGSILKRIKVELPEGLRSILPETSITRITAKVISVSSRLLRTWDPETRDWADGYGHLRELFDAIATELED